MTNSGEIGTEPCRMNNKHPDEMGRTAGENDEEARPKKQGRRERWVDCINYVYSEKQ